MWCIKAEKWFSCLVAHGVSECLEQTVRERRGLAQNSLVTPKKIEYLLILSV
jgi:hypothetical protein